MFLGYSRLHEIIYEAKRDNIAIIDLEQDKVLEYSDLIYYIEGFASFLKEEFHVSKGQRIAIYLPNSWQYVICFYACSLLDCIAVPIDHRLTKVETEFIIRDCSPSLLIQDGSLSVSQKIENLTIELKSRDIPTKRPSLNPGRLSNEPLCILYTGGTTGTQKGALLSHKNILSVLANLATHWQLKRDSEMFLQFLPLTHSGGLNCCLNSSLFCGGTTVIMRKFEALKVIDTIEKYRITVMPAVPTVYNELVKCDQLTKKDISSLRIAFSSGAALPKVTAVRFKEATGITINVGWGLTEASPQLTVCQLGVYKENLVGLPLPGTEIVCLDEQRRKIGKNEIGELAAKGPQVMIGYWNRPEENKNVFTHDGYLLTGDIGYIDDEGLVYVLGRKKNLINTGGYKVWPEEVEQVLLEHPKVKEAAVIGVPDEKYGEVVKAFVVLHEQVTEEELINFCRQRLASYKLPKKIEFVDTIPKSSVGKILRRLLK